MLASDRHEYSYIYILNASDNTLELTKIDLVTYIIYILNIYNSPGIFKHVQWSGWAEITLM
jgi:hypothetical protein